MRRVNLERAKQIYTIIYNKKCCKCEKPSICTIGVKAGFQTEFGFYPLCDEHRIMFNRGDLNL